MNEITTIKLNMTTKHRLDKLREYDITYDGLVNKILDTLVKLGEISND